MECRKCKSKNFGVRQNAKNPNHTDLYCKDCGAWQKFATADEIRLYNEDNGWISVKDRFPPPGELVLCYCNKGGIVLARYSDVYKRWRVANTVDITYWMSLPKPPKGE